MSRKVFSRGYVVTNRLYKAPPWRSVYAISSLELVGIEAFADGAQALRGKIAVQPRGRRVAHDGDAITLANAKRMETECDASTSASICDQVVSR